MADTFKIYHVRVKEVHIQVVEIEAEDEEDARRKVAGGDGLYLSDTNPEDYILEYDHTLDPDTWEVKEVTDG
jgi:hypothetical protein